MTVPVGGVQLIGLTKHFADAAAVDGIDLTIEPGEFFSLLGPSGCGKTTTLRMVAGFERPTAGRIVLSGVDVAHVPPHQRDVNTVFQSYALFPHLSVADNVAFGLRFARVDRAEARRRVGAMLELVQLDGLERRRPHELSGGQQQRVALGRALVLNPAVLLLDEPLGALDARLRKALQVELKALQAQVGTTFVYVTHDQEEALVMSDRMAVMAEGRVQQVGPPREVYEQPRTAFVADFLGVANLLDATVEGEDGAHLRVRLCGEPLRAAGADAALPTGPAQLVIRPERVRLDAQHSANCLPATVTRLVYVGAATQVFVALGDGTTISSLVPNHGGGVGPREGDRLFVHLPPDSLRALASQVQVDQVGDRRPSLTAG